jgi:hypothetical protein
MLKESKKAVQEATKGLPEQYENEKFLDDVIKSSSVLPKIRGIL